MATTRKNNALAVRPKPKQRHPGTTPNTYLASLHAATLRETKTFLPAEIIAQVLDYLPVPELLRFARTSKRMREMVYDDTRWIQKLKMMDCWNEAEARRRFDESMRRKMEAQRVREEEEARRSGADHPFHVNGASGRRKESMTLFDASAADFTSSHGSGHQRALSKNGVQSPIGPLPSKANDAPSPSTIAPIPPITADVFQNVISIRGHARQEYGKIYAALAPYYLDIVRAQNHADPRVFREFRDPEHQARMLAQLRRFAQSDTVQGGHRREEILESIIAVFENAALREFEQGYMANETSGRMRRYAHVLVTLNGGAAAVDLFIHNHALMTGKEQLGHPLACLEGSSGGQVDLAPSRDFFQKLSYTLNLEIKVVDQVFPASVEVMVPFLDRIADDIISEYINSLFDEAHMGNRESYLKLVAGVFEQSLQLVKSLQPPESATSAFNETARKIMVRCFEPHIDLYLKEELDFVKKRSTSELDIWEKQLSAQEASTESFLMSNVTRQAAKKDFMTSFKQVVMMPVNVLPSFTSTKPSAVESNSSARSNTPVPASGIERPSTPRIGAPTNELAAKTAVMNSKLEGINTLFSIELALSLVHLSKASLERTALFIQSREDVVERAKYQCREIFTHLVEVLGFRHVKNGFDKAVSHLSLYNAREASEHGEAGVKPLAVFLELVNVGDLIQQMIDVVYAQELVAPKLIDVDDFLDPAVKQKKQFEQMLDERVAAGLNQGIDVLMDEVEYLCATLQSPSDFYPEQSSASAVEKLAIVDIGPTQTAQRVVELVSSHTDMLTGSAEKNVLDVFNQEVGLRLFTGLCKHIKRQRISVNGAIKLISDTNHYFAFIQSLRNKELLQYFMALREVSQIYLVDGKDAKELAAIIADAERYRGIITVEEVLEFAERRADWLQIRSNVEKAMFGIGCSMM